VKWLSNIWFWLGAALLAAVVRGLFIPVMDIDAAQYASIAREMLDGGSWLQVLHRHDNYLDKPPLLFWVSALSFRLLGVSTGAYKLPSVLAAGLGVYAIFRFSRLFYSVTVARNAAFILASTLGLVVICNDIRTDTLLLAMTTCAVWQLAAWIEQRRWYHLVWGGFFIGLAMLAKGPIGLVMPAFAVGTHLLVQRQWRALFDWHWVPMLALTVLVLVPMCIGLYQQFDARPAAAVNGRIGVSGLRFFFWEQSFGRITGENTWKNDTSPFYFLHVYGWAFLPWTLLLPPALVLILRRFWQKFRLPSATTLPEAYAVGGLVLTFLALSLSRYKLPHYIFVTLPWAAVLTACWIDQLPARSGWVRMQTAVAMLYTGLLLVLIAIVFPDLSTTFWILLLGGTGTMMALFWRGEWVAASVLSAVLTACILNAHFYPRLLKYQSSSEAAFWANAHGIPPDKRAFLYRHGHALDFYSQAIVPEVRSPEEAVNRVRQHGIYWLYTHQEGRAALDRAGVRYEVLHTLPHFQVTLLRAQFLSPATRESTLETFYWLKIVEQ
jgi:4-amino-4-deoxy-L-arabinose transferase-like glycosyltransferase